MYICISIVLPVIYIKVTESAVLGDVAEVVSSNPTVGQKIFSAFTGIVDLSFLTIYIYI